MGQLVGEKGTFISWNLGTVCNDRSDMLNPKDIMCCRRLVLEQSIRGYFLSNWARGGEDALHAGGLGVYVLSWHSDRNPGRDTEVDSRLRYCRLRGQSSESRMLEVILTESTLFAKTREK